MKSIGSALSAAAAAARLTIRAAARGAVPPPARLAPLTLPTRLTVLTGLRMRAILAILAILTIFTMAAGARPAAAATARARASDGRRVVVFSPFPIYDPFFFDFWWGAPYGPAYGWMAYGPWPTGAYGPAYGPGWGAATRLSSPAGYATIWSAPGSAAPTVWHVHPWTATLAVDGKIAGEARDYDEPSRALALKPGHHRLTIRHDGYRTLDIDLDIESGRAYDLHYRLTKGSGFEPLSVELPEGRKRD